MAVTKRTRYEVLKRDNHTCRYCGGTAPDVKLTVDHVTPIALGGTDDPSNLVAACRECNAGKSSTIPGGEVVAQVADDAIRWAAAVRTAAREVEADDLRHVGVHERFATRWRAWDKDLEYLPGDAWTSLDGWLDAGLTEAMLLDSLETAIRNRAVSSSNVFRYTAGIVKNKLARIHEVARQLLEEEAADGA